MYISSFTISGYRSLKNVEIKGMLPVCIFHGPNNSGKSNILSAIETIFRRKLLVDETTAGGITKHERPGGFWQGRITDFRDNFFLNGKQDIEFSISVTFTNDELAFLNDVLRQFPDLTKVGHHKILGLDGRIKYVDDNSADMVLERAVFNKKYVVFEVDQAGKKGFFPKVKGLEPEKQLSHFEDLMNLLADSFRVLGSDRYLTDEQISEKLSTTLALTPKTFKTWLFNLSLSRSGHQAFDEIGKMFVSNPFAVGEIGFSHERNEIEIMVQQKSFRLPISRLGSGHQQSLYIIANLVLNKNKMLGIEELEINLSPKIQRQLLEKLKKHISDADLISQVIITSHSDHFQYRPDVRCYGVQHNGEHTTVTQWSQVQRQDFFGRAPRNRA